MPCRITPEKYRELFKQNYPDYELLSDYNGDKNYIHVKCKIDGNEWDTKPNWLKHGAGCQKCYDRRRGQTTKIGKEEFIKRAMVIHGGKYNYDKVVYKNNKTPVIITCPIHGDFLGIPNKIMTRGDGCPKCANKNVTTEDFIEKSKLIHGDKYNYSKVEYIKNTIPVTIICPKHGEFQQTPDKHLQGHGCPICNESHLERNVRQFLLDRNITFIYQVRSKTFSWLGRQSFDFYLPDYKVAIECQGEQHYDKHSFSFDNEHIVDICIERDERKYNVASKHNVPLFYYCKNKKIFQASSIYNEENTYFSLDSLLTAIMKHKNPEDIITETINTNSKWICVGKVPNGSSYCSPNSEGNYDMYIFVDAEAEKKDDFGGFKYFHVKVNSEKDFSGTPRDFYSIPSYKLSHIDIFPEFRDSYYGWLFLGRPKTSEDKIAHEKLMSKLWVENDEVIFQHDSPEEITNGRVEAGHTPRLYSNNTDFGAYFWATKEKGKDPSNHSQYTYYCSAPLEDVYDFQFNPKHYPSLRAAYEKEKVVIVPWGNNENVVAAIAKTLPIIGKRKNN